MGNKVPESKNGIKFEFAYNDRGDRMLVAISERFERSERTEKSVVIPKKIECSNTFEKVFWNEHVFILTIYGVDTKSTFIVDYKEMKLLKVYSNHQTHFYPSNNLVVVCYINKVFIYNTIKNEESILEIKRNIDNYLLTKNNILFAYSRDEKKLTTVNLNNLEFREYNDVDIFYICKENKHLLGKMVYVYTGKNKFEEKYDVKLIDTLTGEFLKNTSLSNYKLERYSAEDLYQEKSHEVSIEDDDSAMEGGEDYRREDYRREEKYEDDEDIALLEIVNVLKK